MRVIAVTPAQQRHSPTRTLSPALLIAGHPGHELRVYGWLEAVRPEVVIITDGSGASGESRLHSSDALLARAGATRSRIYGRFTDAGIYHALLHQDLTVFTRLVDDLTEILVERAIRCVVGDAAEGYNPTHDVCRMVINAAVRLAQQKRQHLIENFAFPLVNRPDEGAQSEGTVCLELDDEALARKMAAARAYVELTSEVDQALSTFGPEAFRRECLMPVDPAEALDPVEVPPFYEKYGEKRVASGAYAQVIRYTQHVRPVADVLARHAPIERIAV